MLTRALNHSWLGKPACRWLLGLVVAGAAVTAVISQTSTPPSIPAVNLAAEPLYARGVRAKPTLTLALSVEFPTVGALYTDQDGYAQTTEYIGYFDPNGCYTYSATNSYFTRTGGATNRGCGGTGFSGNFMNWATSSAIDILRYGMTGGDRWIDTSTQTVLQRAVLRNSFYNSANFRSKRLSNALAAEAVPNTLKGSHTGTIYVANCLDRIYFGTAETGNCDTPGNNANLGTPSTTGVVSLSSLPSGTSPSCANEGGTCTFTGTKAVIYGASSSYYAKIATDSAACTNANFGDPIVGTAKKCYWVDVASVPGLSTATSGALTNENHFKARVEVCDTTGDAVSRPSLCTRYPNGNFKPSGNLQKYSDRVRVSVFGYLKDDTLGRHGGVLRTPMKYVGPKTFDNNFNLVSGANPVGEWDENNGVLVANPHGATEGVSGAINYLNKFGRTGVYGEYKTYDPVGELYYESLRYVQGLSPTPDAVSAITTAMKDGFPVYDTWTDPHPAVTGLTDYSCLKNSIVAIGDVNTHADRFIPGHTPATTNDPERPANLAANEPDFKFWTKVVGGFEANQSVSYTDGQGVSRTTSNPNGANTARWGMEDQALGCCNNNSYYIAGMAYWANTHDIRASGLTTYGAAKARPGMRVSTYVIDVDEYRQVSNDPNYRLKNQFFLASKYGGFTDASGTGNPFLAKDGATVDNSNWLRAGTTNDAKNYFLASNATALLNSINEIFDNILREAGSIAGAAVSTQSLSTSGGYIYQAKFDPSDWSGDLARYTLGLSGSTVTLSNDDSPSPLTVRASTSLDAMTATDLAARKIVVGKTTPTSSATATNFVWTSLDADHQTALRRPMGATTSTPDDPASVGQERLNFVRGDRSLEAPAGPYRKRGSRFGDIVNSAVVYAGAPATSISDAGYLTFYNNNKNRTKALYVGANDGMFHAVNPDTMQELFAYIPSFVVPKLSAYTSPNYIHQAYVDSSPAIGEADLNASGTGARNWKTVVVSGAGGGGQGVFALDVTDPTAFGADKVLWEFTDRDDVDMGNVIGKAQILKFRTTASGVLPAKYKWFAVVASGVNNYVDDGRYSTTGNPTLFLLDLAKASGDSWTSTGSNPNYYKITFPLDLTTMAKGMAGFSVTAGPSGEVQYLYAGDLQGNVWKLDFTGVASANWNIAGVVAHKDATDNPLPMFVAQTGGTTPVRQPITMKPALANGPNRSIVVMFGTGKFLELTDASTPFSTQSVYAVLDAGARIPDRGRLAGVTVSTTAGTLAATAFLWGVPASDGDSSKRAGWYFDLPYSTSSGERQVTNISLLDGSLSFASIEPPLTGCSEGGGRVYDIKLAGASGTFTASTVGVQGEPFWIRTGTSALSVSDTTGGRRQNATYRRFFQGSTGIQVGAAPADTKAVEERPGRLNWRQISNYQDLHR